MSINYELSIFYLCYTYFTATFHNIIKSISTVYLPIPYLTVSAVSFVIASVGT